MPGVAECNRGSVEMDLREEIEERIRERYGSVPKLARILNMSDQTIYSSLKNSLVGSSLSTVMPIINALELDPLQLLNGRLQSTLAEGRDYVTIPLFESIAANQELAPSPDARNYPVPLSLVQQHPDSFLLNVSEEGMSRVLPKGSYALVRPLQDDAGPIEERALYALCLGEGNAIVRRVKSLENGYLLSPDSVDSTFHPRVIDFADQTAPRVRILGQVVWYTLPLDWNFPLP